MIGPEFNVRGLGSGSLSISFRDEGHNWPITRLTLTPSEGLPVVLTLAGPSVESLRHLFQQSEKYIASAKTPRPVKTR